jgi:hypothetical protein
MSEYTQVFATLAGAAVGVVSGLLIQRQIFKRENAREIRDRVYGPMLMQTSKMLDDLMSYNFNSGLASPTMLMNDYLFLTIGQDLKNGWSEVLDSVGKYQKVRHAAELALNESVKQEVGKAFGVDTSRSSCGAEYVWLRLLMGIPMATALDLKSAIFLKRPPQDFIKKEKEKLGENIRIEANICGLEKKLEDFEFLYASMLAKMEKDPYYLDERKQRIRLVKELNELIGQIEPFVKLERAHART